MHSATGRTTRTPPRSIDPGGGDPVTSPTQDALTATTGQAPVLLEARNVVKHFPIRTPEGKQQVQAVDGVSLKVRAGETLGLVGESGCGKSTFGRCLVRLIDVTSGQVIYDGEDITAMSRKALRKRRMDFQMVFQDPYASLNPRRRAAATVEEPMRTHELDPPTSSTTPYAAHATYEHRIGRPTHPSSNM